MNALSGERWPMQAVCQVISDRLAKGLHGLLCGELAQYVLSAECRHSDGQESPDPNGRKLITSCP